jgi:hypothetical protein
LEWCHPCIDSPVVPETTPKRKTKERAKGKPPKKPKKKPAAVEAPATPRPPPKPKRKKIPAGVKLALWEHYFPDKTTGRCYVCQKAVIHVRAFDAAHVKAVANGGTDHISNLRPCCGNCNQSIGTMDLEEYLRTYLQ